MTAGGREYKLILRSPSKLHNNAAIITNSGPKAAIFFINSLFHPTSLCKTELRGVSSIALCEGGHPDCTVATGIAPVPALLHARGVQYVHETECTITTDIDLHKSPKE